MATFKTVGRTGEAATPVDLRDTVRPFHFRDTYAMAGTEDSAATSDDLEVIVIPAGYQLVSLVIVHDDLSTSPTAAIDVGVTGALDVFINGHDVTSAGMAVLGEGAEVGRVAQTSDETLLITFVSGGTLFIADADIQIFGTMIRTMQ